MLYTVISPSLSLSSVKVLFHVGIQAAFDHGIGICTVVEPVLLDALFAACEIVQSKVDGYSVLCLPFTCIKKPSCHHVVATSGDPSASSSKPKPVTLKGFNFFACVEGSLYQVTCRFFIAHDEGSGIHTESLSPSTPYIYEVLPCVILSLLYASHVHEFLHTYHHLFWSVTCNIASGGKLASLNVSIILPGPVLT